MLLKCFMQLSSGLNLHLTLKYEVLLKVSAFPAEMDLNSSQQVNFPLLSFKLNDLIISIKVPKNFSGGANAFFTLMWTSAIIGYESISDHISFVQSPAGLDAAIAYVAGDGATVQSLIEEFLQGSGIPCPAKFDELSGFNSLIDLSKIDTPGFRARVFTWAATGSPAVSPDSTKEIAVSTLLLTVEYIHQLFLIDRSCC